MTISLMPSPATRRRPQPGKDWQDADAGIPEVIEARQRLAALGGPATAPATTQ